MVPGMPCIVSGVKISRVDAIRRVSSDENCKNSFSREYIDTFASVSLVSTLRNEPTKSTGLSIITMKSAFLSSPSTLCNEQKEKSEENNPFSRTTNHYKGSA